MQQSRSVFTDEPDYARGRSLQLFLVDGTPQGIVIASIANWTGKVLAAPRARLTELLKRSEASRTGVYILSGPDPDRPGGLMAYIGEADDIAARLRIHLRAEEKDFFDSLAIIVSTDDNLTKAHARFLESRLIRLVRQSGAVALANGTAPDFQRLPEANRADMLFFTDQLALVLPVLGFDLFRQPMPLGNESLTGTGDTVSFTFDTAGASALGREIDDGFAVLAGSTARRSPTETFPAGYLALRDQLVVEGKLIEGPAPDLYAFAVNVVFSSPSAAASIVAARSASGPREWRLKGTGQLYKDWRAARLEED
jgi:hypothetical protein